MKTVIVILGPTASGKTQFSLELARNIDGEIISADSMQIYRYMDIGTAKPTPEEKQGIPHYLMDEVYPDQEFSVADFQALAYQYIEKILEKGKMPIIVGGTGLYINSLLYNIDFTETVSDWAFREQMQREAEEKGNEYLYRKLQEVDPKAAEKLHVNDLKRIIRALEVFEHTGQTISYHQEISRRNPPRYHYVVIGLTMERQLLYERINQRVDQMFQNGLVDEVKKLMEMGYDKNTIAMQAIGYKEVLVYLRGETSLEEAVEIIKRNSRRYAKRQLTWFRRLENVSWISMDRPNQRGEVLEFIKVSLATSGIFL